MKPCPYCESGNLEVRADDVSYRHVLCLVCGMRGPISAGPVGTGPRAAVEEAIARWDKLPRTPGTVG